MKLKDRVVVITGAAGGLGRVVARHVADEGAELALLGRNVEKLSNLAADLNLPEDRYLVYPADFGDPQAAQLAANKVKETFGGADILLHLVGGWSGGKAVVDVDANEMTAMIQQHVWTTFYIAQAFVPLLEMNNFGRILVISSPFGRSPRAKGAPYAVGKAAQEALMLTLAQELKGSGITANIIMVKTIDVKHAKLNTPTEKNASWTMPEEISEAILYLCSDEAAMVNGVRLPLYGSA